MLFTTKHCVTLALFGAMWCASLIGRPVQAQTATNEQAADSELRQFHSANGLLQRGLYEAAATEYRRFLADHPNHAKAPVAHYGLGVCLFRMGKPADAAVELKAVANQREFEFAVEAMFLLAQCQMAQGEFKDAASGLTRLEKDHAEHDLADDAVALLVEARYRAGEHEAAITACQALNKKWPGSPLRERAEFFAAQSMIARNDSSAAANQLSAMLARYPQGEFASRGGILLAQCLQRSGKADEAALQYRKIVDANSGEYVGDALYGLATLQYEKKQLELASKSLDQLIERFPQHRAIASARMMRGRVCFEQGEYENASPFFSAVAKDSNNWPDQAAYWQAKCELRLGKNQDAAKRLSAAIKKYPDSALMPEMMFDRAVALVRAGDTDAPEALQTFRERHPDHALAAEALHMAAMWQHQHKQYDHSAELCVEFIRAYPKHANAPAITFLLAENQYLADHLKEAAASFKNYLLQYPKSTQAGQAQYRLGIVLYRLNDLDGAQQALEPVATNAGKDPALANALRVLGDIQFQKQDWAGSEKCLVAYLNGAVDSSSSIEAMLKLGLAQARQDHHTEAIATFDRLLSAKDNRSVRTQAEFERGQSLLALNRIEEAAAAFERVMQTDPKSAWAPHAMNHLAALAMQQQQFKAAAQWYAKVAACGVEELQPEALYQQGQALTAAGDLEAARKAFTSLIKNYSTNPRAPAAGARRAIVLCRLKQYEPAIAEITRVQEAGGAKLDPALRTTLAYEKAWCLRELKRPDEARQAYRELLDDRSLTDQSLRSHAMLELAELDAAAGKQEDAIVLLKALSSPASSLDAIPPEVREQARYRLGVCEFEAGHFKEAAALLDEFIQQGVSSPLLPSAHLYCGEALFKNNQYKSAATHFSKVIEDAPKDPASGTAMLRLGECQAQLQQWDQSEQTFTNYLQQYAKSDVWFQAQFGLGWALENRQQYDKAIAEYQKVTAAHQGPTAARAQFQVGECHFALKRHDDALRELMKVDILYAYPEWSAAALYEAGRCLEAMNKAADARAQFEQVQAKFPQSQWAVMAQKRLAELTDSKTTASALPNNEERRP